MVEYECSEVCRLLLGCAVIILNEIDLKSGSNIDRIYSENSCIGKFYQDIEKAIDQVEELTFRAACHIIIHARYINFDLENAKSIRQYDSISNIVYLYGEFHHKEWKAELDVCKFVCVLMNLK